MSGKLLFLATEDWFIRSHFLPLLKRAVSDGYEVAVAARLSDALANVDGIRLIDLPFRRRALMPWEVGRQVSYLNDVIARERPDVIHAIASKPLALLLMARARGAGRVLALTGRGYLSASGSLVAKVTGQRFRGMLRSGLDDPRTMLLVENLADRRWVEGNRPLADRSVAVMPGAGVDPDMFTPKPEPTSPPIVVGVAARLVRSKGIDLVVEAIRALRDRGLDIELRIAGAVDKDNPEHVEEQELERWRTSPGVSLIGRISDVDAFWSTAHIAVLASRGGEGLPRLLLEAAACGRPIVTTDVPGCADFVRDGEIGFVVPPDDAAALVEPIAKLASNVDLRRRLGEAGRARIVGAYTERHAADTAALAWRAVSQSAPNV